nr:MAG TPA: hypothetical protein [Caudoviricetes sp.]
MPLVVHHTFKLRLNYENLGENNEKMKLNLL